MAMFMALKKGEITSDPEDGEMQLPILVANNHILFLDKKASSSGSIKPPMAADLLNYCTGSDWDSAQGASASSPSPITPMQSLRTTTLL